VVWGSYQLTVQAEEMVRKVSEVLDDWRSAELDLLGILGDSVAAYAGAWPAPVL
jgi:hypothetical protein